MPKIVIFPHPGGEHGRQEEIFNTKIEYPNKSKNEYIRWNNGEHARKFLKNKGKLVDNPDIEQEIVFWCEWEPQSKIIHDFHNPKGEKELPNYIQTAFWDTDERIQNTDPFIFGNNFFWAFCRQNRQPDLTELEKGDVILFGSLLNKNFVLDTVFVIKEYIDYDWNSYFAGKLSFLTSECPEYDEITLKAGSCGVTKLFQKFRLYTGVNYYEKDAFNNIFSYFPAKLFSNNYGSVFKRPAIDLSVISTNPDDLKINPQSAKILYISSFEKMLNIWKGVKQQIEAKKLSIGIQTNIPPKNPITYRSELEKPKLKYPPISNLDEDVTQIIIKIVFHSNKQCGALIGNQNRDLNPNEYNPVIYIDTDGYLRATLWDGKADRTLLSKKRVDDNITHTVYYIADLNKNQQAIAIDNKESIHDILNPERENKIVKGKTIEYVIDKNNLHSKYYWQLGTAYSRNKPNTNGFWFTFNGLIKEAKILTNINQKHFEYEENE